MKLYRVKVVFDTVIAAENHVEAEKEAQFLMDSDFEDRPNEVKLSRIRTVDDLPPLWELRSIPWGDHDCFQNVKEILETQGEH